MITAIEIENFKAFGKRQRIELKPITLLFGPNSAGKSSVLHALHYAREILERHNLDADHTISGGEFVDLGGFQSFVHNHGLNLPITLGFEMRRTDDAFLFNLIGQWQAYESEHGAVTQRLTEADTCRVDITVAWSKWLSRPFVSCYAVSVDGQPLVRIVAAADKVGAKIAGLNLKHPVFGPHDVDSAEDRDDEALHLDTIWHAGLMEVAGDAESRVIPLWEQRDALPSFLEDELPIRIGDLGEQAAASVEGLGATTLLATLNLLSWMIIGPGQRLREELQQFRYLGPLRKTPARDYQPPRFPDPARWASGLAAWDILKTEGDEFVSAVSDWLSRPDRLNTGYILKVRRLRELDEASPLMIQLRSERAFDDIDDLNAELDRLPERKKLVLIEQRTGIDVDPEDVGEGIAQIVPVVVAVLSSSARLIAIEQPELHVHPRVQVALGDLLIERASEVPDHGPPPPGLNPAGTLLIETHSEHLLLRLLRRIRETAQGELPELTEELTPADLAVLYVEPGEGGARVKELRIDDNGDFLDQWPEGFFEERGEELFG